MRNERPDWFEFWVIRNFLRENKLNDHSWYGFISPNFGVKTGFSSAFVFETIERIEHQCEVALFSSFPDQLVTFQNTFEQGDPWHPGLLNLSQYFFDSIGMKVSLKNLVHCMHNSVFSNYIVAKPRFWNRWLQIADLFFDFIENYKAAPFDMLVPHDKQFLPIKVFIQERFASLILSQEKFKTFVPRQNMEFLRCEKSMRRLFITFDSLKERYCVTGDAQYLDRFNKLRRDCSINPITLQNHNGAVRPVMAGPS